MTISMGCCWPTGAVGEMPHVLTGQGVGTFTQACHARTAERDAMRSVAGAAWQGIGSQSRGHMVSFGTSLVGFRVATCGSCGTGCCRCGCAGRGSSGRVTKGRMVGMRSSSRLWAKKHTFREQRSPSLHICVRYLQPGE